MSGWPVIHARDLFGQTSRLEAPGQRPDLRNARTLADEIEAERRITAESAADPFKHMPFRFPSLAQIAKTTARNLSEARRHRDVFLHDGSPEYAKTWGANDPKPWTPAARWTP